LFLTMLNLLPAAIFALNSQTPATTSKVPAELKKFTIVYSKRDSVTNRENLYIANGDGTGTKQIVRDGITPVWSPNHSQIAFVRMRGVWVVNADGTNEKNLFTASGEDARIVGLSWGKQPGNPNAESILFAAYSQNQTEIYRIDKNGTKWETPKLESTVQQWFHLSEQAYPVVSPSSKSLAYTANGDIWMAILDDDEWRTGRVAAVAQYDLTARGGSNATLVARRLSWVPNARKLVYEFRRMWGTGTEEIRLLDFTKARDPLLNNDQITHRKIADKALSPCVSPDGKWVLATKVIDWEGLIAIQIATGKAYQLVPGADEGSW
jgi:Tol biopolymer transport system component